jgi:hypothetical protein
MKSMFKYANGYLRQWDWKDAGLLKCCLCAVGVMIGLGIPEKRKKPAFAAAGGVFVLTYIPLMVGFVRSVIRQRERICDEESVDREPEE